MFPPSGWCYSTNNIMPCDNELALQHQLFCENAFSQSIKMFVTVHSIVHEID